MIHISMIRRDQRSFVGFVHRIVHAVKVYTNILTVLSTGLGAVPRANRVLVFLLELFRR